MLSARSDPDFEGFTLDDIENINENKSILSSNGSDIDISDYSSDKEDFENKSDENDIYLHLTDSANGPSENEPNCDPLHKVRPVIDLLFNNYKTVYLPGKNLSVDEAMICYKGRVHFQQYMPTKPTKLGIKVWEVCESDTGYCVNFDVYTVALAENLAH
ncbi:uncharacterized protein LOC115230047, partial [Octopus sinensis]|uniref:Uncharacterized protein LOC115230047 n=1 Tax=Octopus sinensis TaxID=2607531 RepID=A0A6P7TUZ2_9MOLL